MSHALAGRFLFNHKSHLGSPLLTQTGQILMTNIHNSEFLALFTNVAMSLFVLYSYFGAKGVWYLLT